ncbi:VanZ family protein [Bacillus sp. FJAT-29953]|nr:VanZ family protein [Bacillus sp. FJAT-29953]
MKALKWVLRVLPALYMAAIFIQSSLPSDHFVKLPDSNIDHTIKESLHLIEFAILYVLLVLAFLTFRRGEKAESSVASEGDRTVKNVTVASFSFTPGWNLACALFAAFYGISDEIHQSFYPYRSASLFDLVKDFLGISVSYYFIRGALFKGKFAGLAKLLGRVRSVS